jgi:hypothetical protein
MVTSNLHKFRWFGRHSWTHAYIQPHKFRWFGRHSWTHAYIHLLRIQLLERARAAPCISKTVSLTIRCDSTSKQGSQISRLSTPKHILSFSHCQKPVPCTRFLFNSQFSTTLLSTRGQTVANRWKKQTPLRYFKQISANCCSKFEFRTSLCHLVDA